MLFLGFGTSPREKPEELMNICKCSADKTLKSQWGQILIMCSAYNANTFISSLQNHKHEACDENGGFWEENCNCLPDSGVN